MGLSLHNVAGSTVQGVTGEFAGDELVVIFDNEPLYVSD